MRRIALFVLVCMPVMAHAEDPKSKAKAHLQRALGLHKEKQYAEALDEMKTAYALDPKPELLYAIAQLHVQLGQCESALPFYERFLESKPKESAAAKAKQAIHMCKTAPPPAAAQPDVPVVEEDKLPAIEIKPKPPKPAPVTKTVTLPWYTDVLGDVLGGAGVLGTGFGLVQYLGARSANADAEAALTLPERLAHLEDARAARRVAVIAGGVGGALIAAGIVRFATRAPKTETRLVVETSGSGGTVWWRGSF